MQLEHFGALVRKRFGEAFNGDVLHGGGWFVALQEVRGIDWRLGAKALVASDRPGDASWEAYNLNDSHVDKHVIGTTIRIGSLFIASDFQSIKRVNHHRAHQHPYPYTNLCS